MGICLSRRNHDQLVILPGRLCADPFRIPHARPAAHPDPLLSRNRHAPATAKNYRTERQDEKVKYFSPEEVEALFAVIDRHPLSGYYGPAMRLPLYTGLRADELCHLRPEHIEGRQLRVEMRTKGRRHRMVPMTRSARKIDLVDLENPSGEDLGDHEEPGIEKDLESKEWGDSDGPEG